MLMYITRLLWLPFREQAEQGPEALPGPALPEVLPGPWAAAEHPGQPVPPRRALWVQLTSSVPNLHPAPTSTSTSALFAYIHRYIYCLHLYLHPASTPYTCICIYTLRQHPTHINTLRPQSTSKSSLLCTCIHIITLHPQLHLYTRHLHLHLHLHLTPCTPPVSQPRPPLWLLPHPPPQAAVWVSSELWSNLFATFITYFSIEHCPSTKITSCFHSL